MIESISIEQRLAELDIQLPAASEPKGSYANCVRASNFLYVSGKGPNVQPAPVGKLGREFSVAQGYDFARMAGLEILATVKAELGSLDAVVRVVKIQGFINAVESFDDHPKVLDGCSDLLAQVFDDKGLHARSVFGAVSVRANLPLVIDSIFEINSA
jgi:enamine deaminase RidA (YjgF/YER057c/UK114 family)